MTEQELLAELTRLTAARDRLFDSKGWYSTSGVKLHNERIKALETRLNAIRKGECQ